jgi:hypothetical protein
VDSNYEEAADHGFQEARGCINVNATDQASASALIGIGDACPRFSMNSEACGVVRRPSDAELSVIGVKLRGCRPCRPQPLRR